MHIEDNRNRMVAIYARVSTEHDAQLAALENQISWYDEIMDKHPNWKLYKKYIDRGITGTSAKKRPQFMKMIQDAEQGKFDLIVTREVSRFARNTVDTLSYTRQLKKSGVEVYFSSDNIWTMDTDGELRLSIMATLAQDESRKISMRVKAGQRSSMEKGTFFQNGSILGYEYDKVNRTMVVNEEQAETVRMIFDLYNSGIGIRQIQWELEKAGRETASGKTIWYAGAISRVLRNPFYCGRMMWYKQYVPDYLEQKKVRNHGEKEQFTVMGTHTPLVSEEEFDLANARLDSKRIRPDSPITKKVSQNVWCRKLKCSCGSSFNRGKWHKDKKTGIMEYGYQCYSQKQTGTVATRKRKGLSTDGICEVPAVPEWKLDAMALYLFRILSVDKARIIELATESYKRHISDAEANDDIEKIESLLKEKSKLKRRLDNVLELRIDGEITKEQFLEKKQLYQKQMSEIDEKLQILEPDPDDSNDYEEKLRLLKEVLEKSLDFSKGNRIPDYVIDAFVKEVIVYKDFFKWKFNLIPDTYELNVKGRQSKFLVEQINPPNGLGLHRLLSSRKVDHQKSLKIAEFIFTKEDAQKYVDTHDNVKRINAWRDIKIEVYI